MGKTSNAVKDRWNAKAYDSILLRIPKGRKADIEAHAAACGESVNGFLNRTLCAELDFTPEEWKTVMPEEIPQKD